MYGVSRKPIRKRFAHAKGRLPCKTCGFYDVSVDYLLGLTEDKERHWSKAKITLSGAVETLRLARFGWKRAERIVRNVKAGMANDWRIWRNLWNLKWRSNKKHQKTGQRCSSRRERVKGFQNEKRNILHQAQRTWRKIAFWTDYAIGCKSVHKNRYPDKAKFVTYIDDSLSVEEGLNSADNLAWVSFRARSIEKSKVPISAFDPKKAFRKSLQTLKTPKRNWSFRPSETSVSALLIGEMKHTDIHGLFWKRTKGCLRFFRIERGLTFSEHGYAKTLEQNFFIATVSFSGRNWQHNLS